MKALFITLILILVPAFVRAQSEIPTEDIEKLRTLVQGFGQKKAKVSLLTRTLIGVKGKLIRSRADSFDLRIGKSTNTVPFSNVLEIEVGGENISFVPDPATRNYGSWEAVAQIYPATKILIVYSNGKAIKGFSNSTTRTHLVAADENARSRIDIPRGDIVAVYGLVGGYGGIKAGASKGAEGMNTAKHPILDGLFAVVGALVGVAKSDGRPILIYSR